MSEDSDNDDKSLTLSELGYRKKLLEWEQKIGESYDKTLITLSGGALGLTIAFVKDIVGKDAIECVFLLLVSWIAWTVSLTSLLATLYFAQFAYRRTIEQLDAGTIYNETPGGGYTGVIHFLNAAGGIGFIIGVIAIVRFAYINLN